jgi:hypothetical protein
VRRILSGDRLAVVLGVEVDQLEALCDDFIKSSDAVATLDY